MTATQLLVVVLLAALFLAAPIYCARQQPRQPFFQGMFLGLLGGAFGGGIMGIATLVILFKVSPSAFSYDAYFGWCLVVEGFGLFGGGCLGMWLGILVWGRARAKELRGA